MIECDCSDDSGEPWECGAVWWPKARKQHICCECGETISPGTRYEIAKGIWGGRPGTYRTCRSCVTIRDSLCPNGYLYGGLVCAVLECKGVDYRHVPDQKFWAAIDAEDARRVAKHRERANGNAK